MTIVVTVKVTDGIVLAADSATSFTDAKGNVAKVYNNANKIFNLVKVWPIGAMTYGAGGIGASSISTLSKNLRKRLIDQGRHRLAESGGPEKMAREYLDVFLDVMRRPGPTTDILHGVYPDGWAGESITLSYGKSSGARYLEVVFHYPHWAPHGDSSIVISDRGGRSETHVIKKGETATISFDLLNCGSILQLRIAPVFQPKALGMNDDERMLCCICQGFWIISASGRDSLL